MASTLAEKMPRGGPGGHGGPGGGRALETAAGVLGVSADELRSALEGGKSLADVAAEKGVAKDELVARLTKAVETRLAEQVSSGRLTQAQADERKAELTARITEQVDRKGLPDRGDRGGRQGPRD